MALTYSFLVTASEFKKLRRLRLWHWQQAQAAQRMYDRSCQDAADPAFQTSWDMFQSLAEAYSHQRKHHTSVVDLLNAFFPDEADTAERDHDIERSKAERRKKTDEQG